MTGRATIGEGTVRLTGESAELERAFRASETRIQQFARTADRQLGPFHRSLQQGQQVAHAYAGQLGVAGRAVTALSASLAAARTALLGTSAALATFGVASAVRGLTANTRAGLEFANSLDDLSRSTDLTTDTLQRFQLVALNNGIAIARADDAILRFVKRLGEAREGTGRFALTAERLNIDLSSTEAALIQTIEAIGNAADGADRAAIAASAFGVTNAVLARIAEDGAAGFREQGDAVADLGAVLDGNLIPAAAALNTRIDLVREGMRRAFQAGLVEEMTGALAESGAEMDRLVQLARTIGENIGAAVDSALALVDQVRAVETGMRAVLALARMGPEVVFGEASPTTPIAEALAEREGVLNRQRELQATAAQLETATGRPHRSAQQQLTENAAELRRANEAIRQLLADRLPGPISLSDQAGELRRPATPEETRNRVLELPPLPGLQRTQVDRGEILGMDRGGSGSGGGRSAADELEALTRQLDRFRRSVDDSYDRAQALAGANRLLTESVGAGLIPQAEATALLDDYRDQLDATAAATARHSKTVEASLDAAADYGAIAGQAIENNFARAVASIRNADDALNVLIGTLQDVANAILQAAVVDPIAEGIGGFFGDLVGGLFGPSKLAAPAGTIGSPTKLIAPGVFAAGGMADSPAVRTVAPMADFVDAPRFALGGIPAIIHPGEGIFTPQQMRNADRLLAAAMQAPPVQVTVINHSSADVETRQGGDGNPQLVIRDALRGEVSSGALDGVMRRRYGLVPARTR